MTSQGHVHSGELGWELGSVHPDLCDLSNLTKDRSWARAIPPAFISALAPAQTAARADPGDTTQPASSGEFWILGHTPSATVRAVPLAHGGAADCSWGRHLGQCALREFLGSMMGVLGGVSAAKGTCCLMLQAQFGNLSMFFELMHYY